MRLSEYKRWNDLYKCEQCGRTTRMYNTGVVLDKKRDYKPIRLCQDCQVDFFIKETEDSMHVKLNTKRIQLWGKGFDGKNL